MKVRVKHCDNRLFGVNSQLSNCGAHFFIRLASVNCDYSFWRIDESLI